VGCRERFAPQHGTGDPLYTAMILLHKVVEILEHTDGDRGAVVGMVALDGRCMSRPPGDGELLRDAVAADRFLEKVERGFLVPLLGEEKVHGLASLIQRNSGKKKDHTLKNVLLVNALLVILFLSDTHGGRVHDLRIAEATPYPLPAGSGLLQDLGFLSFTLPYVEILMPMKKPRGEELSLEQQLANQELNQQRLRIEHVNSSIKRCRIVKDRLRLWKAGVRDLVMELCCALHNFRVRLTPWQPMI
jgi:DDE superfamily endonuclease